MAVVPISVLASDGDDDEDDGNDGDGFSMCIGSSNISEREAFESWLCGSCIPRNHNRRQ